MSCRGFCEERCGTHPVLTMVNELRVGHNASRRARQAGNLPHVAASLRDAGPPVADVAASLRDAGPPVAVVAASLRDAGPPVAERPGYVRIVLAVVAWLGFAAASAAQSPALHFPHYVGLPPGAIGTQQLGRGGPVAGVFQPVEIAAPEGVLVAMAEGGALGEPQKAPVRVGLLIGQVYRICVLNIPFHAGQEVFPTIEVVDRLYTPAGQETRFPIKIELTLEDLRLAMDGKFVTRVIYLEDPERALPVASGGRPQSWFEVPPGRDPLVVADALGRPVAIVRLGGRVPDHGQGLDPQFLFGCPPLVKYPAPAPAARVGDLRRGAREPAPRLTVLPRPPRRAPSEAAPTAAVLPEVSPR